MWLRGANMWIAAHWSLPARCLAAAGVLVALAGGLPRSAPAQLAPPPSSDAPPGMVYVPAGTTDIGSARGRPVEQPVFSADVDAFWLDRHLVTVAQFRRFVQATDYTTEAEHFGDAGLFDRAKKQWQLVDGAQWRTPLGPDSAAAPDDHPVTQVSWNDAAAFCTWAGKRLPTEVEWEHAARGARNDRQPYAWGASLTKQGATRANTWEGTFPVENTGADGYQHTSPVGAFGETPLGLTDMGGNVWEWTASAFRPYPLQDVSADPPGRSMVQRGGSFMCHASYCHGYRVSARSHASPETSLFHVGFRCARDASSAAN